MLHMEPIYHEGAIKARVIPIRANIVGPPLSATSSSAFAAACHSGRFVEHDVAIKIPGIVNSVLDLVAVAVELPEFRAIGRITWRPLSFRGALLL